VSTNSTLRLGPLPRGKPVKVIIQLSVELKRTLDRYAALHGQIHKESVDAGILIPHMLEVFMARDRVFRKWEGRVPARDPSLREPDA